MKDDLNITGIVTLRRYDSFHKLIDTVTIRNMIVNGGLTFFAGKILNLTDAEITHIALGDSDQSVAKTNTALFSEKMRSLSRYMILGEQSGEMLIEAVFLGNESPTFTINEIGLFDSNDTLLARTTLSSSDAFMKTPQETISVTWRILLGGEL